MTNFIQNLLVSEELKTDIKTDIHKIKEVNKTQDRLSHKITSLYKEWE